jgi:protein TonB
MSACSWPHLRSEPDRSRHTAGRVAWAGVISVLIHLTIASTVTGGPSGRLVSSNTPPHLTARLIEAVTAPVAQLQRLADEASEPEKKEHRAAPRQRASVTPSRADEGAHAETSTPAGHAVADGPDLTYYAARQLDVYPTLSSPLDLRYTAKAAAAGIAGRALVLLLIDDTGAVDEVALVDAEPGGYFEEEVRRAFASARFTPALKGGRAVRSRVLVHVNYGVEDASPQPNLK